MGNSVGTIGVLLILVAYYLSQRGTMTIRDPGYLWMNFIGALGIVFSLFWNWNLPAFLMESAWAGISMWGLVKLRQKKQ